MGQGHLFIGSAHLYGQNFNFQIDHSFIKTFSREKLSYETFDHISISPFPYL